MVKTYEHKIIDADSIVKRDTSGTTLGERGWRVVAVITPLAPPGKHNHSRLILERQL